MLYLGPGTDPILDEDEIEAESRNRQEYFSLLNERAAYADTAFERYGMMEENAVVWLGKE